MDESKRQVADNPHLVKNLNTGIISNIDQDGYKAAVARKKRNKEIKALREEVCDLKERIIKLEAVVNSDK
jgi:hypothetical protein